MTAAQSELPYAFACAQCYGTVPLVTIAEGVRLTCSECGHRQEVTREFVEQVCSGSGVRPRALLEGLAPVAFGDAAPSGRMPLGKSSSGSMPQASPGISSMRSRRAAMEESKSTSSRRRAVSENGDAFDSLADTHAPDALPADDESSTSSSSRKTTRRVAASAESSRKTTRRIATSASEDEGAQFYGAGVPSFNDSLGDTVTPVRSGAAVAAKGKADSYRGPFAPVLSSSRRSAATVTGEVERVNESGRKLAIISVAPYAASVAVVMIILLLAIETLPPMMYGTLDGVLTLPAFTLLALFAGGLLFVAGTVQGVWRGIAMTAIGLLPMLFVVPAVFAAPGLAYAVLLTLPLIIAISYGAAAAASMYANGTLIKVVAGVAGFVVIATQVSIGLGERGVLQLPGTGEGSPILFVLGLFMGIGPLLNIYNLVSPDEARARLTVIAHWVGYLGIPALLILVLSFNLLLTLETVIVLLFMFGWVFAAGAGMRDMLVYLELKQRGYMGTDDQQDADTFRASAVVGAPSASDSKRFSAIPAATSFTGTLDNVDDADESQGTDPLPAITEEGPNLFSPQPDASQDEETETGDEEVTS